MTSSFLIAKYAKMLTNNINAENSAAHQAYDADSNSESVDEANDTEKDTKNSSPKRKRRKAPKVENRKAKADSSKESALTSQQPKKNRSSSPRRRKRQTKANLRESKSRDENYSNQPAKRRDESTAKMEAKSSKAISVKTQDSLDNTLRSREAEAQVMPMEVTCSDPNLRLSTRRPACRPTLRLQTRRPDSPSSLSRRASKTPSPQYDATTPKMKWNSKSPRWGSRQNSKSPTNRWNTLSPSNKSRSPPSGRRKRHRSLSRTRSEIIVDARQYKTQEDAIANVVLWFALITHVGKQRKGNKDEMCCVVQPNSKFRTYWDSVSMMFILFVIAFTPLQIAFLAPPLMETAVSESDKWGCDPDQLPCFNYWGIFIMDIVVDLFFTADILVNFRSAWIDIDPFSPTFKSQRYSCKLACLNYLRGMLFIDVLSVLPFWMLDLSQDLNGQGGLLRMPRLLRLAKLLKLLKVLRVSRVFSRWNKIITTTCSSNVVMLLELTAVLVVSVHLMGCSWYLIASLQLGFEEDYLQKYGPDDTTTSTTTPNTTTTVGYEPDPQWWDGNTWIMGGVYDFQRKSISEMYLASIYFALTTITTVGYGDITPVIFSERITAFVCMIVGVIVFGYVVGQVTVLIRALTLRRNMFFEDMSTLQAYLHSYPFSKATRTRAIDYFYYTYNTNKYHVDNEARKTTLSHFSPYLKRSLAYAEFRHYLIGWKWNLKSEIQRFMAMNPATPLPFLERASQHIIKDLCAVLVCEVYGPVEKVAIQGGPCTKMFTLDTGSMCKWSNSYDDLNGKPKMMGWSYVEKGERFGTDSLLLYLQHRQHSRDNKTHIATWWQSFQTLTFCDFICLSAEKFAEILMCYPKHCARMRLHILKAKFRAFFRSILQQSKESLAAAFYLLPAPSGPKLTLEQQVQVLCKQNSSLRHSMKHMTEKFDEVQRQQQQMQEVINNQQQLMARQHKELMTFLKKQKKQGRLHESNERVSE